MYDQTQNQGAYKEGMEKILQIDQKDNAKERTTRELEEELRKAQQELSVRQWQMERTAQAIEAKEKKISELKEVLLKAQQELIVAQWQMEQTAQAIEAKEKKISELKEELLKVQQELIVAQWRMERTAQAKEKKISELEEELHEAQQKLSVASEHNRKIDELEQENKSLSEKNKVIEERSLGLDKSNQEKEHENRQWGVRYQQLEQNEALLKQRCEVLGRNNGLLEQHLGWLEQKVNVPKQIALEQGDLRQQVSGWQEKCQQLAKERDDWKLCAQQTEKNHEQFYSGALEENRELRVKIAQLEYEKRQSNTNRENPNFDRGRGSQSDTRVIVQPPQQPRVINLPHAQTPLSNNLYTFIKKRSHPIAPAVPGNEKEQSKNQPPEKRQRSEN